MDAQIAYSLLSVIQDRSARVLKGTDTDARRFARLVVDGGLLDQLRDRSKATPVGMSLDLGAFLDELNLVDLVSDGDAKRLIGGLRTTVGDFGKRLLEGDGLAGIRNALDGLLSGLVPTGGEAPPVVAMLRQQVGIGISFVTTLRNLASLDLAREIPREWTTYFFGEDGFVTIDGIPLVPPAHGDLLARLAPAELTPAGVRASFNGLKGLLNERTGEQYVRDLIRITVEVAGDRRYQLRARLPQLLAATGDPAKATRWFKGFASMAESLVTGAVEEASLGIAQFQTNPIIAAAAATYAGTAARKAAQHVFLAEVGV